MITIIAASLRSQRCLRRDDDGKDDDCDDKDDDCDANYHRSILCNTNSANATIEMYIVERSKKRMMMTAMMMMRMTNVMITILPALPHKR